MEPQITNTLRVSSAPPALDFDISRFDPSQYNLDDPLQCIAFQSMLRRFMSIVKNCPALLEHHADAVSNFCEKVAEEKCWILAINVVPEFRDSPYVHLSAMIRRELIAVRVAVISGRQNR